MSLPTQNAFSGVVAVTVVFSDYSCDGGWVFVVATSVVVIDLAHPPCENSLLSTLQPEKITYINVCFSN